VGNSLQGGDEFFCIELFAGSAGLTFAMKHFSEIALVSTIMWLVPKREWYAWTLPRKKTKSW